jgi:hypothetical protein
MQPGAMLKLNLAVCPSAACLPISCAKVPHAIALWLAVLRRPVLGWVRWQANAQASRSRGIRHRRLALESVSSFLHAQIPSQLWCVALALSHSKQCKM